MNNIKPFCLPRQFKEDVSAFLENNSIWLCLVLVLLIALTVFLILFLGRKKKKGKEKKSEASPDQWTEALGGKSNIIEASGARSRLTVSLKDSALLDKEKLTALGVTNIIMMSEKAVLVIENQAESVADLLNKSGN